MESHQTHLNATHFRYLSKAELEDPFIFINQFCRYDTGLELFREDILNLMKSALSPKEKFFTGKQPGYAYYQQQLIKIIEINNVIYAKQLYLGLADIHPLYRKRHEPFALLVSTKENLANTNFYYRTLESREINNIQLFLKDFFNYKSLARWRNMLDDVLIHAYKEGGIGYFEYEPSPFTIINYLEKLAEATFLIFEINRLKDLEPTHQAINYIRQAGDSLIQHHEKDGVLENQGNIKTENREDAEAESKKII